MNYYHQTIYRLRILAFLLTCALLAVSYVLFVSLRGWEEDLERLRAERNLSEVLERENDKLRPLNYPIDFVRKLHKHHHKKFTKSTA